MKVMVIETPKGTIVCSLATSSDANVSSTIANFEQKAGAGYFNGLKFHRVEDWVIQGGDPTGTGSGGDKMPAEYNTLPFKTGALGVARGPDKSRNSDCQYFIVRRESRFLDGEYTNFGQVIEGMDVVRAITKGDPMTTVTVEDQP